MFNKVWNVCKDVLLVSLLVFLLAPQFAGGSEEIMPLGDLLQKVARNEQLTPHELETLRLKLNDLESHDATLAGWIGPDGMRVQNARFETAHFSNSPLESSSVSFINTPVEIAHNTETPITWEFAMRGGSEIFSPVAASASIGMSDPMRRIGISGTIEWEGNADGLRWMYAIRYNEADVEIWRDTCFILPSGTASNVTFPVSCVLSLSGADTTDHIKIVIAQTSGIGIDLVKCYLTFWVIH